MKGALFTALLFSTCTLFAATDPDSLALDEAAFQDFYRNFIDSVSNSLQYERGTITIGQQLATLTVPAGFKYIKGKDADMVLEELWGNPPSGEGERSLGMLFPENSGPNDTSSLMYAIDITYSEDGYIDDSDAAEIDYDELLEEMQGDMVEANEYRRENGYEQVALIGWATKPFYDNAGKKLYWAKELQFGESEEHTLNYNIRVLGRKGYLQLNVIGGMEALNYIESHMDEILPAIDFNEGNRYADFNPKLDKVAAYGIGGLIAGKVLLKAGLLAKVGLLLAKFWKVIALAVVGALAGIRKLLSKGESA